MSESHGELTRIDMASLPSHVRRVLDGVDDLLLHHLPMNVRFRRVTSREGLLLHGPSGWAEASPFWDYDPVESSTWLAGAHSVATGPRRTSVRDRVPVNVTIPVVCPSDAYQRVISSGGCATAKVKVADPNTELSEDIARVEAVAQALVDTVGAEHGRIRVDVNAAWDVDYARKAVPQLDRAAMQVGGLEYAEQPCASVEDLATLRRSIDVPIAADESIRRAEDPQAVARAQAADVAIIKIAPLGGIERALQIGEQTGLDLVVSSALESSVGLGVGVRAASLLPGTVRACGLATSHFLACDVVPQSLLPVDGFLPVCDVEPDQSLVDARPVDAEIRDRWLHRLDLMCAHLESVAGGHHA